MRLHARLIVVDGKVLCPPSGHWQSLERCEHCADMRAIEGDANCQVVVCNPEVERFSATVENMIRA